MSNNLFGYADAVVYLLQYSNEQIYKIGHTKKLNTRLRRLNILLPYQVNPIHVIRTDDPRWLEHYWHKTFESKRRFGSGIFRASEWFDLNEKDIKEFKKHEQMLKPTKQDNIAVASLFAEDALRQEALKRIADYYDRIAKRNPEAVVKLAKSYMWQINDFDNKLIALQDKGYSIEEAIKIWMKDAKQDADAKLKKT